MPGYTGYHTNKKNSWSVTTTTIVVGVHLIFVAGIYQVAQTEYVQNLIKVSKLTTIKEPPKLQKPETDPKPEPFPEVMPEPVPPVAKAPQESIEPLPPQDLLPSLPTEGDAMEAGPVGGAPFVIGKKGSAFSGYEGLLTASIQAVYQPPPDMTDNVGYAVLCQLTLDDDGYVLAYHLVKSSGNVAFDRSAQLALSRLRQVRPPPPGMSRTVVVKFFPP